MDYHLLLNIIFGLLPSLLWLLYYLSKDSHPEPKFMVVTVFFLGMASTLPVLFIEVGLRNVLLQLNLGFLTASIIYWFFVIGFSEELFKYLVVKFQVLHSSYFDEPVDAMVYMVISALGFAALENILYLYKANYGLFGQALVQDTLQLSFVRFIGGTFLHTLCSAVVGYALAISFYDTKERYIGVATGLFIATLLHGLYDFSIMTLEGPLQLAIPVIILVTLAFLVFSGFTKLKKVKSTCEVIKR